MIRIIQVLIVFVSTMSWSQHDYKVFYNDHVECYFDNSSANELVVYDTINGSIVKSLKIDEGSWKLNWLKIAIQETKDGWAKIENIMIAPAGSDSVNAELFKLKNCWIKIENLKVFTSHQSLSPVPTFTKFYKRPNQESELIYKAEVYLELDVVETMGLWVKVSFVLDGVNYTGWIEPGEYCAYPWTACP